MNTKFLSYMLSLLVVLGLSGSAMAALDLTGDTANNSTVGDYDIESAEVVLYPPDPQDIEEYMKVGLKMKDGGNLPGLIILEFDVDNNTGTGSGVSMVELMDTCEGGGRIKTDVPGIDISIFLFLRDQGDGISTSWCYNCWGPEGTCMKRDKTCECDGENCYTSGEVCGPGMDECYVRGALCYKDGEVCKIGDDICNVLVGDCIISINCSVGRRTGEWYSNPMEGGGEATNPADRGRIDIPLPKGTNSGYCSAGSTNAGDPCDDDGDCTDGSCDFNTADCYTFPWKRIVNTAHSMSPIFDINAAKDPANLKWQVSTWYATDFATNGNDDFFVMITGGTCAAITDVIPNAGLAAATGATADFGYGDFDNDGDIDGRDAGRFKKHSGREDLPSIKPTCECTEGLHPADDTWCGSP